jgi:hypothetical protein
VRLGWGAETNRASLFPCPLSSAQTHDISNSGASLNGLSGLVEPGKKVEIDFRDQTASYRVQWIGKNGSPKAGRTGVRCREKKYI